MNILRAEAYLNRLGQDQTPLSELYDDDEMLQSAMVTLFPDFEYPDFSHKTLGQIRKQYFSNPRALQP